MNVRHKIIRQIGGINHGIKEHPQSLQSDKENGKLPECHPFPKMLFLKRNNMAERFWRRANKSVGATCRTIYRFVRTFETTVYAFFHKARSRLTDDGQPGLQSIHCPTQPSCIMDLSFFGVYVHVQHSFAFEAPAFRVGGKTGQPPLRVASRAPAPAVAYHLVAVDW